VNALRTLALLLLLMPCAARAEEGEEKDPETQLPADGAEPVTTESGLVYSVLEAGPEGGDRPAEGDKVKVHYTCHLMDGTVVDSSRGKAPVSVVLGRVLPAWNEGIALMRPGARYKLTVPPKLAFGAEGRGRIPAGATVVFDIELIEVTARPRWTDFVEESVKTTESGLKLQVLAAGAGEDVKRADSVEFAFAIFNEGKQLVHSTAIDGEKIAAKCGELPVKFLNELAPIMKEGTKLLVRVPPALGFPGRFPPRGGPAIESDQDSIWVIELLRKAAPLPVPAFAPPAEEKLVKTESGLQYEVIKKGDETAAPPKMGQLVRVHYAGWLTDGTLFDSSFPRAFEARFQLGQVIRGWNEGLQLMKPGAIYRFVIPPPLAYGPRPPPDSSIPANATLIFHVELIGVE